MFLGAFPVYTALTIISATAVVITAAYHLWAIQRMFLGQFNEKWAELWDINWRERLTLYPLGAIVILFGFYPVPVFHLINGSLHPLITMIKAVGGIP